MWTNGGLACKPCCDRSLESELGAAGTGAAQQTDGQTPRQRGRDEHQLAGRISRSEAPTLQLPSISAGQTWQSAYAPQLASRISRLAAPAEPSPLASAGRLGEYGQALRQLTTIGRRDLPPIPLPVPVVLRLESVPTPRREGFAVQTL